MKYLLDPQGGSKKKIQMLQTTHAQTETVSFLGFGGEVKEVASELSSFSDLREVGGHFLSIPIVVFSY